MILTTAEHNKNLAALLTGFAEAQKDRWSREVWKTSRLRGIGTLEGRLLWLFVYALRTWEHDDTKENYLTEAQQLAIYKKARTLHQNLCGCAELELDISLNTDYAVCEEGSVRVAIDTVFINPGGMLVFVPEGDTGEVFVPEGTYPD